MKYLICCKSCGTILLKTKNPILGILPAEIKCSNSNCKKLLKMPEDIIIIPEKKKRPGLEMGRGEQRA